MTAHSAPAHPAPREPAPRTRPGQWVLLVVGSVLTALGLGAVATGLVLAGAAAAQEGGRYLTGGPERHQTIAYALTSPSVVLDTEGAPMPQLPFVEQLAGVQVRVTAVDPQQEVFVGVAATEDVGRYLEGVARAQLGPGLRDGDEVGERIDVSGSRTPDRPGNQTFWAASDQGTGTREVEFDLQPGRWSLVVMNADASRPVWVEVQAGARSDLAGPAAAWLLVGGLIGLVVGVPLLLLGAAGLGRDVGRGAPPRGTGPGAALAAGPGGQRAWPSVYPVTVTGFLDARLSRGLWLVKWLLAIPHFLVLAVLWFALLVTTVAAGLAILFTGRYPRSWFSFCVGVLRWSWRVGFYAYSALGTDRYPPFTLAPAEYPADLDVAYPERLSRGLVLVKWWLLAIPHLLVVGALTGGAGRTGIGAEWDETGRATTAGWGPSLLGLLVLIAAVVLLFTGRYRYELFALVVGINRWLYRVGAYVLLMRDEYPPFRLDQGPVEPPPVPGPATRPAPEPPEAGRAPSPAPPEQAPPPPPRSDPGAPPPPWA
jgi:hypothetical protein